MSVISEFLQDMDRQWKQPQPEKIELSLIGSTALMLQANYLRGTKDSDVLETHALTPEIKDELLKLAGPDTDLHHKHHLYIEIVSGGLPFLPQLPLWHPVVDLNRSLQHFEILALDVIDVVVSKLKRFSPNDVSDIRAMADLELVDHRRLLERFQSAVDMFSMDARADDLPKYVRNLHRVERDFLFVPETEIDLPDWI